MHLALLSKNLTSSRKFYSVGNIIVTDNSPRRARENYGEADLRRLTGDVVAQYPRRDNSAIGTEEILQILLRHIFRQAADVQIRAFDRLAARSRVRHLKKTKIKLRSKKCSFFSPNKYLTDYPNKNDGVNVARCLIFYTNKSKKKKRKNVPTR